MFERAVAAVWIIAGAIAGWPAAHEVAPQAGLDPSWRFSLSWVHEQGLRFGSDIVFNYGPLGFIAQPSLGAGRWFFVGMIGLGALLAVASAAIYLTLRELGVNLHAAGAATVAIAVISPPAFLHTEYAAIAVATWLLVRVLRRVPTSAAVWAGMGVLVALFWLVKVSVGPMLLVVVLLAALAQSWRSAGVAFAGWVVALPVLWVGARQSLGDLGTWLRGTAQLSAGHTEALNLELPGRAWEYWIVAGVCAGSAFVLFDRPALKALWERREIRAVSATLIGLALAWFTFKQGFVRHAPRSQVFFFTAALLLAVSIPWKRLDRNRLGAAGLTCMLTLVSYAIIASEGSLPGLINPGRPIAAFAGDAQLVLSSGARAEATEEALAQARTEYAISQEMLERIGGSPVHLDPTEITAAWAYGFDWSPVPTLQRYLAYTLGLDQRNATALRSANGPQFVLRESGIATDNRYTVGDGPAYHRELLCSFRIVAVESKWTLLQRSTNRCGELSEMSSTYVRGGDPVRLPDLGDDTVVLASIDFGSNPFEAARSLLYKPASNPHMELDGFRVRMVADTATSPTPVSFPPVTAWDWHMGAAVPRPETITLDRDATVTLYSMTISSD